MPKPKAPKKRRVNEPDTDRRKRVAALYRSGLSIRDIAAEMGVTYQAVHSMLQRIGVTMRPRGGNQGHHSRHRK